MEVYPEKRQCIESCAYIVAHDVMCAVHFVVAFVHPLKLITVISFHLILSAINTSSNAFDVNVAKQNRESTEGYSKSIVW